VNTGWKTFGILISGTYVLLLSEKVLIDPSNDVTIGFLTY